MTLETPIEKAIRLAGGVTILARALGTSKQSIINWRLRNQVPPDRCLAIEKHTGVNRRDLCPKWRDYWPYLADPGDSA